MLWRQRRMSKTKSGGAGREEADVMIKVYSKASFLARGSTCSRCVHRNSQPSFPSRYGYSCIYQSSLSEWFSRAVLLLRLPWLLGCSVARLLSRGLKVAMYYRAAPKRQLYGLLSYNSAFRCRSSDRSCFFYMPSLFRTAVCHNLARIVPKRDN